MGQAKAPRSLRSIAIVKSVGKTKQHEAGPKPPAVACLKAALFSVSYLALGTVAFEPAHAQTARATQSQAASRLPQIEITAPEAKRRANTVPAQRADRGTQRHRSQPARQPEQAAAPKPFAVSQDARTGTVGYYSDSTSVATKTNTPLLNVPQSAAVLTKEFIQDQSTHSITDLSRYVPGVAVHQGEGNRDELVIRGVDSSGISLSTVSEMACNTIAISTTRRASKC
jgi:catecholate siderophore receptor